MNNKIYKIVTVVLVAGVMHSCFVAKDYKRPEVKTDNLYRTEQTLTDSTSLGNLSWDKLFTDPILQGHIKKGLQNNLDIRIAMQTINAANANMKQGSAGYFPTLNLGADWTHQILSRNSQFGRLLQDRTVDQYQLTGNLSWEADIWGKIRSNKRAANASYLQTIAAQQAVQTQLVSNIASTYFQLMALDAQLKVVDSTLVNRNQSIETIKALKDAGNVNEVGVKQTEAQLYATQIIKEDLKNNIVILENTMSILLGEAPRKIERGTFENQKVTADINLGIPAMALSKRPDVLAAEYNLISNFEMTNVAKSSFYPSLKVTATGGLQSIDLKEWFSANSLFANIVTGLTQPVFNQRQIRTRYEVAKANQEKAYLQFEQSLLTAGKEVSDALQQYTNETTKLSIRTQQVDALKKAADYSDELLTYGLVNYLEVLTAKDQALNTELNLIDNQYKQYNAVIMLYKALGGGW
ncbi:NodT family efflux transporter outer membrane factor (OMF) lipoprotein [Flavobacterium arsenatis]|uniref:NodT family efflux transporter outer membrane factor (OMF) lipoprotein n=1 Tax=Flavobacterium arsenatis TaxID=1484332 RepID=A0ABU1TTF2_9FLAO|nr:efflux transporter outer membrane subunit [Flavobacterium arsenatis]MDR6969111.1 NodT family efflux transporter outer membrane factor (OMF) lipoprotein [Flavobacterium arsenatis]